MQEVLVITIVLIAFGCLVHRIWRFIKSFKEKTANPCQNCQSNCKYAQFIQTKMAEKEKIEQKKEKKRKRDLLF